MIWDPQASEFRDVPGVRAQLGLETVLDRLAALETGIDTDEAALAALTARVTALEAANVALTARVAALEAQEVLVPSLDVKAIDGVNVLDYAEVPVRDWQPVILESPEEGKLYRVQPIRDDAGAVNFDLVQSDTLTASDGRRFRLAVKVIDGVANLDELEAL